MFRFARSLALLVLLSSSGHLNAADDRTASGVSDTDVIEFILDLNRGVDAMQKYYPVDGLIFVVHPENETPKESIVTRADIAKLARTGGVPHRPGHLSSGLVLNSLDRQCDKVVLQFSSLEVLSPLRNRHICQRGVLQITLVKVNGQTKMSRQELLSLTSERIITEAVKTP